jgi:hypothetical protein
MILDDPDDDDDDDDDDVRSEHLGCLITRNQQKQDILR